MEKFKKFAARKKWKVRLFDIEGFADSVSCAFPTIVWVLIVTLSTITGLPGTKDTGRDACVPCFSEGVTCKGFAGVRANFSKNQEQNVKRKRDGRHPVLSWDIRPVCRIILLANTFQLLGGCLPPRMHAISSECHLQDCHLHWFEYCYINSLLLSPCLSWSSFFSSLFFSFFKQSVRLISLCQRLSRSFLSRSNMSVARSDDTLVSERVCLGEVLS